MEPSNLIVRMPNWLGDFVMATPILLDLKEHFPKARITAMCQGELATLLLHEKRVDEIFQYSRPNEFLRRQRRDIITRLRQGKYDTGLLLTNSFSSAWWFWLGQVKNRIGFKADSRSLFLTKALPFPKERGMEHLVTTYKCLLGPLQIPVTESTPRLVVSDEERKEVGEILQQHHVPNAAKIVGINPTAAYGPAKCWPPDRFREFAKKLLEDPSVYVLFFGDPSGTSVVKEICQGLSPRAVNLAGLTTLRELCALISICDLFVTNDSGPMHIAAALKTPLLALFGSTNEIATGPYQHGRIIHKHVDCSPCYLRTCPIDFRCMRWIHVDEVYEAALGLLKKSSLDRS